MASTLQQAQADLFLSSLGQKGGILITDTTAITGDFKVLVVLSDATFTTLTTNYTKNGTSIATTGSDWGTLVAGTIISGKITACTLATGTVLLVR